ncbi:uncharacterized protein LOC131615041 [Vicia villosa]|uniref:uncharacterized protein LOC131615041 n=1 Tax=Vicia villosa TaxID=3911 RepID=UPI00273C5DBE|nr:uncharacterized protein LOC131615041 [Vicia villosa]
MDTSSSERTVAEISDYHLTHDKIRKEIVASQRNDYASLGRYALNVDEGLQTFERMTFREMMSFAERAIYGDAVLSPKIGPDHQAEILSNSDQLSLQMNPAYSEDDEYDESLSSSVCLPISVPWSDADAESLVLGLFIFGKNFTQIKKFLENKGMGEILSFYYGKFYKSDGYRRWSECRKLKGRKCMIAKKLSTKMRQHDLLSRLNPHVSKELQDTLSKVSKSYVEGKTSLEKYISSTKSIVGLGIFAEAVSIAKENGVLTRIDLEPRKNSCEEFSAPSCKAFSSLGPGDIIQSLTGGFRLSKTRSNELFWEAVWPRLLARGWHSEQPMNQDYVTSKDDLVFLIPGVDKFSRRKLLKGQHYFDSVKDVLSKVVAEPNIIVLEEEEVEEGGSNENDFSDDHRQCYLKPRSSTCNKVHTSLVHSGKLSDLREFKYVPSNKVHRVEVDVDGKRYKGHTYSRRVKPSKDMSKSITQRSTKLSVIDTNRLPERKLLKVKQKRYPPVELEYASAMTTDPLSESNGGSSPRLVESKILIYGRKKTHSFIGVSNSGVSVKKERDSPDNDANKMVESQKNQHTCVFDDSQLKRVLKHHQFYRRVRSGDSNHAAVPTKRRRLTACAKAENRRIVQNLSGDLGSDKVGFSYSSSFLDANQNGSLNALPKDRSVVENNEKSSRNDSFQCMSLEIEKSESLPLSTPWEVVEEPLRRPCDVGSMEQQADINARRQSSRNSKMTVKALECITYNFWQNKNDIQTHTCIFSPCRKARTRGKTKPRRQFLDHWNAVLVQQEKHLRGDGSVS